VFRYAITDRSLYPGDELQKRAGLVGRASRWTRDGIDLIQLREKDLPAAEIAALAREILKAISSAGSETKLLINSRADIAVATGAHGVHLTSHLDELTVEQVRTLYRSNNLPSPIVSISCHDLKEVHRAREEQADVILFAPVFEKIIVGGEAIRGRGFVELRDACTAASPIPVYALGGVTEQNMSSCLDAGAAGVAGIRLFKDI
jgi:thiamine-phosphate pyrophosphorylase